ncbi:hypothetical protein KUV22_15885 [Microbulbifer agarilyticus]|uniref:hypothetical protein n=1 Tax=Microbulbifer agarilyticus TaxID=260552 RepID=UPI001C93EFC7|nr:hypothetical protein [Microbulbifer agarilyticus]MBY6191909.1 hypothetical protein [Microbulbifer agarilyticus]
MPNDQLISLLSAFTAILSAIYAMRGNHIAKRALSIAEEENQSKKEGLSAYLIEGINYVNEENNYVFAFNLSIINRASVSNSAQRIELIITYIRHNNSAGNIILQHDSSLSQSIHGHKVTPFAQVVEVPAKYACTNWCLFSHHDTARRLGRIDKYTLRITDTAGEVNEIDSYLIREYRIA